MHSVRKLTKPNALYSALMTALMLSGGISSGSVFAAAETIKLDIDFTDQTILDMQHTQNAFIEDGRLQPARPSRYLGDYTAYASGQSILTGGAQYQAVAQGDLNGDGYADVVLSGLDGSVQLLLNNQSSQPFKDVTPQSVATLAVPVSAFAVTDMDQDGDLDLVAITAHQVVMWINSADLNAPFVTNSTIEITTQDQVINSLLVFDANNDGWQDIALGILGQDVLMMHSANADMSFDEIALGEESYTTGLSAGDVNQDGWIDLVVGNNKAANQLYLNSPDGFFSQGQAISPSANASSDIALFDINQDGFLDVVEATLGQGTYVYFGDGSDTPFAEGKNTRLMPHTAQTKQLLVTDLNRDAAPDLVLLNTDQASRYYLHNNQNEVPFDQVQGVAIQADSLNMASAAIADFDADGDVDLFSVYTDAATFLYDNHSFANPYSASTPVALQAQASARWLVSADVDLDAKADLLWVDAQGAVHLALNDGSGVTPYAQSSQLSLTEVNRLYVADINKDNRLDLVLARNGVNQLLMNNGSAQPFEGVTPVAVGDAADNTASLALVDFNQDGWLDLVSVNQNAANRVYLHNQSAAPYTSADTLVLNNSSYDSRDVLVLDIDTDGLMDIVVGNFDAVTQIYFNTPASGFFDNVVPAPLTNQVSQTQSLASVDYNKDGKPDIVEANVAQSYVVLTNRNILPVSASKQLPLGDADAGLHHLQVVEVKDNQHKEIFARNKDNALLFFESLDAPEVVVQLSDTLSGYAFVDVTDQQQPDLVYSANGLQLLSSNVRHGVNQLSLQKIDDLSRGRGTKYYQVDINNDGFLDILGAYGSSVNISYNFDELMKTDSIQGIGAEWNYSIGDVDGDGDMDVMSYVNTSLKLWRNNGSDLPFDNVTAELLDNAGTSLFKSPAFQIELSDVNNDGKVDLLMSAVPLDSNTRVVRIYFNQGAETLYSAAASVDLEYSLSNNSPYFMLIDVNQDGYLDLILASSLDDANQMGLILNDQSAHAYDATQQLLLTDTQDQPLNISLNKRHVRIDDINHDGRIDFTVDEQSLWFLATDQVAQFEVVDIAALASQANKNIDEYFWVDINQDGWLDLIAEENDRLFAYINTQNSDRFDFNAGIQLLNQGIHDFIGILDLDARQGPEIVLNILSEFHIYTLSDLNDALNVFNAKAQSNGVTTVGDNIDRVVLTATAADEQDCVDCGIDYWVSNNGGAQFFKVLSGQAFNFPTSGNALVWQVDFNATSAQSQTHLSALNIVSNLVPVITGQQSLTTAEDTPLTLTLDDLQVQDSDSVYPTDFTLTVLPADNDEYSVTDTTITPAADFYGELTVNVTVNDGLESSEPFALQITVTSVLDAPRIIGLKDGVQFDVSEEEPFLLTIGQLQIEDIDDAMATRSFSLVLAASANSVATAESQGSSLFITPKNQSSDQLAIPVQLVSSDGLLLSAPFDLPVTITEANDQPRIIGLTQLLSTAEEQAFEFRVAYLNIEDADSNSHTVQVLEGEHYSVVGQSVIPDKDFTGTLQVQVQVDDGAAANQLSDVFNAALVVTNINDKPVFDDTKPSLIASINEDSSISLGADNLPFTDADPSDTLIVEVAAGEHFSVSADPVFIGRKIITPEQDFSGTLNLNVRVFDGAQYSDEIGVTIEVTEVNDVPVVQGVKQALTVVQGKEFTLNPDLLLIANPEANEAIQIEVLPGDNYSLVDGSPNVLVPTLNAGLISVNVVAIDEAGQRSAVKAINLTVASNDVGPIVTGQVNFPVIKEDGTLTITLADLIIEPAQPISGEYQLLIQNNSNAYTVLQNAAGETVVQFHQVGSVLVDVMVLNGGQPVPFQYQVSVENVNDKPVIWRQVNSWQTGENSAFEVSLEDFEVTDEDSLASDLTLVVKDGEHYTHSAKGSNSYFVIPRPGFIGTLDVTVVVSDGLNESEPFTAKMTVRDESGSSGGGSFSISILCGLVALLVLRRRRQTK